MAYLESKPRYEILDGLRGVAALMVVAFHLFETYSGGMKTQIINHGYLAVDFFFMLSGFVLGYAYDDRWKRPTPALPTGGGGWKDSSSINKGNNKTPSPCGEGRGGAMSLSDFFKRRIVRLHPMIVLGGLIGLLLFYHYDTSFFPLINSTPWWQALLIYLTTILMIPTPWIDGRGWEENFPINSPQWSLILEYIANIVYALILCRLPKRALWVLVIIAAFFTLDLGAGLNILGDKPEHYWSEGTMTGGWLFTGWEGHIAVVRLAFPILAGLLISRCRRFITVRGGFWWCSLLIMVSISIPHLGAMNGIYEVLIILALFPIIIAMGAGSRMTDPRSQKVCKFLGDISFPLYITHIFARYLQMAWKESHADLPIETHIMVSVSLYILALLVAYAALKLYDEPVREWLKEHWLRRNCSHSAK